jgi:DtxR family transcriptional regulator, manganese transport regulator
MTDNAGKRGGARGTFTTLVAPEDQANHHRQTRRARQTEIAEDYVELIAELIDTAGEARSVEIARRFGVTPASVAKMIARLRESGLVVTQPYRAVFLTDEGRRIADRSKRRHQIVFEFLRAIGVPEEAARADAEGIEHHVGDATLAAFDRIVRTKR